jgi:branched-subunit amino acid transport protein
MSFWLTTAGMVAVTFGSRFGGLVWRFATLPPFWARFLHFVPIAVFAALVTPSLEGARGEWAIRLAAVAVAGAVAWRTRQVAVALGVGLGAYWLLRFVL